ncbi:MAG: hypothetical protein B6D62_01265 [Candidatus Cloacimonas sp. 4484_275]|nr:MAG: hypothetical protein B6D62_01265 [Candidatus Cloacimonas sp. 4484_275]
MNLTEIEKFTEERERLNKLVLEEFADLEIKRFFGLDSQVYRDDVLPQKTKEMLGLVALQCHEIGVSDAELEEIISVGLIVGGSITIPHIRRAVDFWKNLKK